MTKRKVKTFKGFIRDLVYNNPRADRQDPISGKPSQDWYDKRMLNETKKDNE